MKKIILLAALFYSGYEKIYSQAGRPDPAFGINGIVKSDIGKPDFIGNVALKVLPGKEDDIFIIAGMSGEAFIIKRHASGSLDSAYGKNGFSDLVIMEGGDATIQPNGKIIVVGTIDNGFGVAGFNTNGRLDTSFSGDGIQTNNFGAKAGHPSAVALQPDGQIVVAGNVT